jgi:Lar family restriction alleviation protein
MDIKNCPFCGGEAFYDAVDVLIMIGCKTCGYNRAWNGVITSVPHGEPISNPASACLLYYNKNADQEAIDAWNKRISE